MSVFPLTSEWQLSVSLLTVTATLSHLAVMMRLHRTSAPHQQFESNLWFLLAVGNEAEPRPTSSLKSLKREGVFLSRVHLRTCVWRLLCVIFIDRCWEAGVSQSQEIRLERSHSLCASQYCDFKAIDKLFLWTNPSVLACNRVCTELRPSSSLHPVRQLYRLILFGWHKKGKEGTMRGVNNTNLMFFSLSCLPLFLVDCLSFHFLFNFA